MRRSTVILVAAVMGVSLALSSVLLYLNAKAMVLGGGDITLHWNVHGEGWPEFALLGALCVLSVVALLQFYEEAA